MTGWCRKFYRPSEVLIINSHRELLDDINERRKMGLARHVECKERNLFKKYLLEFFEGKRHIWLAERGWG